MFDFLKNIFSPSKPKHTITTTYTVQKGQTVYTEKTGQEVHAEHTEKPAQPEQTSISNARQKVKELLKEATNFKRQKKYDEAVTKLEEALESKGSSHLNIK
jgi:uncharacterized membrane protein (UPF0182 family)